MGTVRFEENPILVQDIQSLDQKFIFAEATEGELGNAGSIINTSNKQRMKPCWNTDDGVLMVALGPTPTAVWRSVTGVMEITPV